MVDPKARAWKEIDLDSLAYNACVLQERLASGCDLMAVVKADAYGHGAVPVSKRLELEGVDAFAVACLENRSPAGGSGGHDLGFGLHPARGGSYAGLLASDPDRRG